MTRRLLQAVVSAEHVNVPDESETPVNDTTYPMHTCESNEVYWNICTQTSVDEFPVDMNQETFIIVPYCKNHPEN